MATLSYLHLLEERGKKRDLIFSASLPRKFFHNAKHSKVFTYLQASAIYNQLMDLKEIPLLMEGCKCPNS